MASLSRCGGRPWTGQGQDLPNFTYDPWWVRLRPQSLPCESRKPHGDLRMKTRAAVAWKAGAPLTIETVDLDGPRAGGVVVEV